MKLSAVLDGYWLEKRLEFSENTIRNYSYVFRYLLEFLGDVEFAKISSNDIRRFLDYLRTKRKMSKRSVHDAWIPLSSLWTWTEKELQTPHIIRGKIAEPTYTETVIEPFTADEVKRLVDAAEAKDEWVRRGKLVRSKRRTAERDKAIIFTFADSGLRASELCALTIKDYDAKRGRLHVRHGKGDKGRFVVIGQRTRKAIWRYLTKRPNAVPGEPLFATNTNSHMKREQIYHLIVKLGTQAGVTNAHPHRFRHTFAITFLRNGGNVLLLQELLGHESLEMVTIYAKMAERDVDAGVKHSPVDSWKI